MPRKALHHAELTATNERTRRALASFANGLQLLCHPEGAPATEGPPQPTDSVIDARSIYDALVTTIVRVVFLFLSGELTHPHVTWSELLGTLRRLDEALPPDERLLDAFPFLGQATVDDDAVRAALSQLFAIPRESLDVEHLGTVYESMMGYAVQIAREPSVVLLCRRQAGHAQLSQLVGLESLLAEPAPRRAEILLSKGIDIGGRMAAALERSTSVADLARALKVRASPLTPDVIAPSGLALMATHERRRSGSHYTPRALADRIVADTLGPLVEGRDASTLLTIKVCDPAMGSGVFLLAACRFLAAQLGDTVPDAHRAVAEHCLYGVDKNASVVLVTKLSLQLLARSTEHITALDRTLRHGDSLVSFDFPREFADVFALPREGFDAFVGNPPWVSYAGRAAQPLDPVTYALFASNYQSFAGYRNLQGLFIERSATLLRPGGRLGFIIPSSMSEQDGYAPTRAAHDRLCICDESLPDLGNEAFSGVFQPCMALVSTRLRAAPEALPSIWPIERTHLDAAGHALLEKLGAHPPLPAHLFGERGLQTSSGDRQDMRKEPDERRTLALRGGGDIEPFVRRPPSLYCDPERLSCRVRPMDDWTHVRVLIRQTARVPLASLSDGAAFRNSILAGFADGIYPATFLVAYLNTAPIRWLHYVRHRDARQGMPQLKIGHLRATPAPPDRALVAELAAFGEILSAQNTGIDPAAQRELDLAVARAFGLTDTERELIARWWDQLT